MSYWTEFLTIALVHLFAVASPGPDFAVVSRYALSFGRKAGYSVAAGIATGIIIHVAYSLVGVAVIIHQNDWVYLTLLAIGALYLGYIGLGAITAKPRANVGDDVDAVKLPRKRRAFWVGFLTNGLNVKATLFFLTLFTTVISPTTPFSIKLGYGVYLTLATGAWFVFLTWLLTQPKVFKKLWPFSHWIDRLMGAILIALSLSLLWEWLQLVL
ncbi:threonine/homoserine/homoserine lactone efflux protein [Idiomarina aquatica]|uniref:Threonine/homoserine/homoserine lactone efflux protein n=1 Tax=Idiomarina aquatica TaxID=1327752 RepID=A0A4R6PPK7_9GAMM|nr:LysE family translocator [Idiomarina aquatica]TDP40659.1 threonine/homoserine/homoserine lactone efflux protein [Idiomarina aquatica]